MFCFMKLTGLNSYICYVVIEFVNLTARYKLIGILNQETLR